MDLNKYWVDVRAVMEKLPRQQIYYIISIDNPDKGITAGRVMDMSDPKQVARRIVERTHVLATPEQIEAHQVAQKAQNDSYAATELARKGQLAMPQSLQDLVQMATTVVRDAHPKQQPEPPSKPKEK